MKENLYETCSGSFAGPGAKFIVLNEVIVDAAYDILPRLYIPSAMNEMDGKF